MRLYLKFYPSYTPWMSVGIIHTCTVLLENPVTLTENAASTKAVVYFTENSQYYVQIMIL